MDLTDREARYRTYLEFASLIRGVSFVPNWMADGTSFWYPEGAPAKTVIWKVDPLAGTKDALIDAARLRKALAEVLEHEPPYEGLPFDRIELVDGEKSFQFELEGHDFVCDLETYTVRKLPAPGRSLNAAPNPGAGTSREERERFTPRLVRKGESAGAPDVYEVLSPDKRWFAGVVDHQLAIRSTYDGRHHVVTSDGAPDHSWEIQNAQWSPDSLKVGARKIDRRGVHKVPLVHWLKPVEEIEWAPVTKVGGKLAQNELYVVDVQSGNAVRVDAGAEPDQQVFALPWLPSGRELLVQATDRCQTRRTVFAADPFTGATREILTETSETFLQGIEGVVQFTPVLERDQFLWRSERSGWAHLYLYDLDGKLVRQLTEGEWLVQHVVGVDEEEGWAYFTAIHLDSESPYETHLCRVSLEGGPLERLTTTKGTHDVVVSPSRKALFDSHSWPDRKTVVECAKADGTARCVLAEADVSKLDELGWTPPEQFVVKAADGVTDLYGWMYLPSDFDPSRKYPVIDGIYGGPQSNWAPRRFTQETGLFAQALAQLGFVTFVVDARGTPGRGKAFQDVVFKKFGQHEIPDHAAVLRQLAQTRPYMDLTRVGIYGGSWGGYMTARAMLTAPDVYHVGVAVNGVYDHIDHQALAIEAYMRLPQDNPEGYAASDSLKLAGNLQGKLLLVHATSDVNATFSATMKLVEALTRTGRSYDLIILPEHNHHPTGQAYAYYTDAHRRYFVEHLKP